MPGSEPRYTFVTLQLQTHLYKLFVVARLPVMNVDIILEATSRDPELSLDRRKWLTNLSNIILVTNQIRVWTKSPKVVYLHNLYTGFDRNSRRKIQKCFYNVSTREKRVLPAEDCLCKCLLIYGNFYLTATLHLACKGHLYSMKYFICFSLFKVYGRITFILNFI